MPHLELELELQLTKPHMAWMLGVAGWHLGANLSHFFKKRLIEKNNNTSRVRHEKNKTPHKKGETMAAE